MSGLEQKNRKEKQNITKQNTGMVICCYAHSTPLSVSPLSIGLGQVIPAAVDCVVLSAKMAVSAAVVADTMGDGAGDAVSAAMATATLSGPILMLSRWTPTTGATGSSQI
jgi:hypothetical protein